MAGGLAKLITRGHRSAGSCVGRGYLLDSRVTPKEQQRRARLITEATAWGVVNGHGDLDVLLDGDRVRPVSDLLAEFGRHLHREGRAVGDLSATIFAMASRHEDFRRLLSGAWAIVRRWQAGQPVQHHRPVPAKVARALVTIGLVQEDYDFACVVLLGFCGGPRPGEILRAQHKHLHFYGRPAGRRCFLVITEPKSKTRGGP